MALNLGSYNVVKGILENTNIEINLIEKTSF